AEKFESRDQCPDEKDDDRRLSCYDRFFSPTFTPSVNSKSKTEKPVTTEAQQPNFSEISKCRAENDKEARLNCYDKLFPQDKAVQAESK
ncbi:type VI secretion protein, partial [Escherichia coli]|nr:type VI secretion protein [Escherichia coli]